MKVLYKPLGLLFGVLGGLVASAVFERLWRTVSGQTETPDATDPDRGWAEILTAAALQGAIFAGVKALVNRAGAKGFERATGTWPA